MAILISKLPSLAYLQRRKISRHLANSISLMASRVRRRAREPLMQGVDSAVRARGPAKPRANGHKCIRPSETSGQPSGRPFHSAWRELQDRRSPEASGHRAQQGHLRLLRLSTRWPPPWLLIVKFQLAVFVCKPKGDVCRLRDTYAILHSRQLRMLISGN